MAHLSEVIFWISGQKSKHELADRVEANDHKMGSVVATQKRGPRKGGVEGLTRPQSHVTDAL